mgnify:FL=1|tara:strand:- start:1181 stop:1819 length:639 start_codon:yes stop_codon:yes gene_type:complete
MEIIERNLPNIGAVEGKLPEEIIKNFWELIEEAKKKPDDMKNELAGNIKSSIRLDASSDLLKNFMEDALPKFIDKYLKSFGLPEKRKSKEGDQWNLKSLWVNFQKKHEFNPPHDHDGSFSFVIWMKIPTSFEEQRKLPIAVDSNSDRLISNFTFIYTDILGNIRNFSYNMEKEAEGYLVMFPSRLLHQVFPFYKSTGERISISGNLDIGTAQ